MYIFFTPSTFHTTLMKILYTDKSLKRKTNILIEFSNICEILINK